MARRAKGEYIHKKTTTALIHCLLHLLTLLLLLLLMLLMVLLQFYCCARGSHLRLISINRSIVGACYSISRRNTDWHGHN